MTPHERARAWRKSMGLSEHALAARLRVARSTVQRMESGVNPSTGETVRPEDFHRYRLACAAIAGGLEGWDWPPSPEG